MEWNNLNIYIQIDPNIPDVPGLGLILIPAKFQMFMSKYLQEVWRFGKDQAYLVNLIFKNLMLPEPNTKVYAVFTLPFYFNNGNKGQ